MLSAPLYKNYSFTEWELQLPFLWPSWSLKFLQRGALSTIPAKWGFLFLLQFLLSSCFLVTFMFLIFHISNQFFSTDDHVHQNLNTLKPLLLSTIPSPITLSSFTFLLSFHRHIFLKQGIPHLIFIYTLNLLDIGLKAHLYGNSSSWALRGRKNLLILQRQQWQSWDLNSCQFDSRTQDINSNKLDSI